MLTSFLLFLPSCRYLRQQLKIGEYSLESVKEWAKQDSIWVADSLKRVMADKKVLEKTPADPNIGTDEKNLQGGDPYTGYYIICGSFTNTDNAKLSARNYSNEGYKTTIISATKSDGTNVKLVSVKTFKDKSEADVFLKEFQTKSDPRAWIYSRE